MYYWVKIRARLWLVILLCITSWVFAWCMWNTTDSVAQNSIIVFGDYTMTIENVYQNISHDTIIDQRIQNRILGAYSIPWYDTYNNTIIITEDKVSPNASLEDYVQASIGWIDQTRWQYRSLWFEHNSTPCGDRKLSSIMVSFSLVRSIPNTLQQTLYFVHYYIQRLDTITMISISTEDESQLQQLIPMLSTISCISLTQ